MSISTLALGLLAATASATSLRGPTDELAELRSAAQAYVAYRQASAATSATKQQWTAKTAKAAVINAILGANSNAAARNQPVEEEPAAVAEAEAVGTSTSTGVDAGPEGTTTTGAAGGDGGGTTTGGTGGGGGGGGTTTGGGGGGGGGTTTGGGGGGSGGGTTTGGNNSTTTGNGPSPGGQTVRGQFFYTATCDQSSSLFTLPITGCTDLSTYVSTLCAKLDVPPLLCPFASVTASCSGGYVKGALYVSEAKINGGGSCGANADVFTINIVQSGVCYSLDIADNYGIGFEGTCA